MRTREVYLVKDETLLDAQTRIIDLAIVDPVSYIEVRYAATNGVTSCIDHQIHDNVPSIELVDGSDVLQSLSMMDWQALDFYTNGRIPFQVLTELGGAVQQESVIIPFGRYPNDPDYWFDARKYRNPQLRLTHALTISPTVGFVSGSGRLNVIAHVMESGAGPSKGFLTAKQHKSWTTLASGEEVTNLPRDLATRLLIFRSLRSLSPIHVTIPSLKLSIDHDRWVPVHKDVPDILARNREVFGRVTQVKGVLTANAGTVLSDVFTIESAAIAILDPTNFGHISGIVGERVSTQIIHMPTATSVALQATPQLGVLTLLGDSLHSTLAIPFGRIEDPGTWLDPTKHQDIRLIVTQAFVGGAAAVILQQLRK